MTTTLIPASDYERIFGVIYSVLEERTHIAHSCVFFALIGSMILNQKYGIEARPRAGAAAYLVDAAGKNVSVMGKFDNDLLVSTDDAFHCWIEAQGIATLITDADGNKQAKGGAAYARGKILVVFLDAGSGEWSPNRVVRHLPRVDFDEVWVVGLHGELGNGYVYAAAQLVMVNGNAPIFLVHVSPTFDSWTVQRTQ